MFIIEMLRKVNKIFKAGKKRRAGRFLSPVRRIERVYPPSNQRLVAMTFDDGPSALSPSPIPKNCKNPEAGLSAHLMETLEKYNAKGSFDIIGDTSKNYPDKKGKDNTANWGGLRHDHYPDFEMDHLGGAQNQESLTTKIAQNHAVCNHTYSHVLFGPIKFIYGRRAHLTGLKEVVEDILKLNNLASEKYGVKPTLARPPHYVDPIKKTPSTPAALSPIASGHRFPNSYDAYAITGHDYLAASFDGGGWKPSSGNYKADVAAMVYPIKNTLETDPDSLNGQIIFQKDGVNMTRQTPVADALPLQLKLLTQAGYKVVSVYELIDISPFEDLPDTHPAFASARAILKAGYICAYPNNHFYPDRLLTFGELVSMVTPRAIYSARLKFFSDIKRIGGEAEKKYESIIDQIISTPISLPDSHPYALNFKYAKYCGYLKGFENYSIKSKVTMENIINFCGNISTIRIKIDSDLHAFINRGEAAIILSEVLLNE